MHRLISFYTGIDDSDHNNTYKIRGENIIYRDRISLASNNEKLTEIFSSHEGIFGKYKILDIVINSLESFVWAEEENGAIKPYEPKIYQDQELVNPWTETILKNLGYEVGKDAFSCSGDYFFSEEAIDKITVGDLDKIINSGGVNNIEVKIKKID